MPLFLVSAVPPWSPARRARSALILPEGKQDGGGWARAVRSEGRSILTPGSMRGPMRGSLHGIGCVCCVRPDAAADLLAGLFRDWVRARQTPFDEVVLVEEDAAAVERRAQALRSHALVAARFDLRPDRLPV
ncbi:hypothetical protein [Acidomonas methanolica]|uniref:hypothetical protein n=1 Tax=Acidomonas methanolica TaxID=437 RepID=UPI00211A30F1|nr:hypothetical protein [Acidomonas methanolica]MCQ9155006.1 hypothetical protein [Acidomonas methanolica]